MEMPKLKRAIGAFILGLANKKSPIHLIDMHVIREIATLAVEEFAQIIVVLMMKTKPKTGKINVFIGLTNRYFQTWERIARPPGPIGPYFIAHTRDKELGDVIFVASWEGPFVHVLRYICRKKTWRTCTPHWKCIDIDGALSATPLTDGEHIYVVNKYDRMYEYIVATDSWEESALKESEIHSKYDSARGKDVVVGRDIICATPFDHACAASGTANMIYSIEDGDFWTYFVDGSIVYSRITREGFGLSSIDRAFCLDDDSATLVTNTDDIHEITNGAVRYLGHWTHGTITNIVMLS